MYHINLKLLFSLLYLVCSGLDGISQSEIRGKIINANTGKVIIGASVNLMASKKGVVADSTGYFNFSIPRAKKTDSIVISSVGFHALKMGVNKAKELSEFRLNEAFKDMKVVTLKAFSNRSSSGSIYESAAFFRAWNFEKTGGEIGRIIAVPPTEYKLEKVKFKVNNTCDSCLFKLHIRSIKFGLPGEELLTDSISILVNRQNVWSNSTGMPEFDLSSYSIVLKGSQIFVGVEVAGCVQPAKKSCSLSFVGTDKGNFVFKSNTKSDWQQSVGDYDIYEKVEFSF
jgi:hypothetical protein